MLQQGYLASGELFHISLDSITTLPQFTALIQKELRTLVTSH
jgi:hypothetical protein